MGRLLYRAGRTACYVRIPDFPVRATVELILE